MQYRPRLYHEQVDQTTLKWFSWRVPPPPMADPEIEWEGLKCLSQN